MRNLKHIFVLLMLLCGLQLQAQTQAQAKALYDEGNYEEAKPALESLLKKQPTNANLNLWYGVCCLETGDISEAVKYLEQAVKRRATGGQFYLGKAYYQASRFEEAVKTVETYISDLKKRKKETDEAETLLEKCRNGLREIRGVERVTVIDSIVVDKPAFLTHYRLSPESGLLTSDNEFSPQGALEGGTVYQNELGNIAYFSGKEDSTLSIFRAVRLLDGSIELAPLSNEINKGQNTNYPFVTSDGNTIYFAADGKESMGGYDIFVTRFNSNNNTYLQPENIGMPFNSPFNDYMYAVDEFNNLGWFASDRYQPEGKVCIYVFIPNTSKQVYDYENTERDRLIGLSRLSSIRDTWTDQSAVDAALERLGRVKQPTVQQAAVKHEFEFSIDDTRTYYKISDFQSADAREFFRQYRQMVQSLDELNNRLDSQREQYATASSNQKQDLAPAILDLEKRVAQLQKDIDRAANMVRREEQAFLKQ